ncbi:MAG TPA: DUF2007 domain-containing protein [Parachlamydiaceae bacterium]|nr:DUF2007 domain-containing protein [Parachlamydiaceae bacterium]
MDDKNKLVTLYRTYDNFEADLIKSYLESEDITCFLNTNDASGVLPYLALTQGGTEICVWSDDLEEAKKLLKKMKSSES